MIVNRATGQWGIESEYTPEVASHELGRFIVQAGAPAAAIERMVIRAERSTSGDRTDLVLEWQASSLRLPVAVTAN